MPRPPRFSYAHALHHVTLRCNNREFLFTDPSFELFRRILQEMRANYPLSLYNYCLMTNHVHLLFKVSFAGTLSEAMHWLSTTFTRKFNKATGRNGHVWEGRFRSTIIEEATGFLRCMAYLDLNPVRARMAASPGEYRWCGHRALRKEDASELDFHSAYLELGPGVTSRYRLYNDLLAEEAARPAFSLSREYFMGSPKFIRKMVVRFGLDEGRFLRRRDLRPGLVSVGPRRGIPAP
jgi:putative transposase